jgi:hypothetical protein
MHMIAAVRGATFIDPFDGVVEIIASGFTLLYPTYDCPLLIGGRRFF